MEEKTKEIEKENQNLKAPEESDDAPQSEIDKSRAKIRHLQIEKESLKPAYNFADLKNSDAPQSEIKKSQAKTKTSEAEFTKERSDYNKRFPSERYESNIVADFEEVEEMKSQIYLIRDKESNQSQNKIKL